MYSFQEWLNEGKFSKAMLGLAMALPPAAYFVAKNEPSVIEPEVTYDIKVVPQEESLYYIVTFNYINARRQDNPSLIRRFKQEAKDAVIDRILDDKGLAFKVGDRTIRTAGINKLEFVEIQLMPASNKIQVIMKTGT